MLPGCQEGCSGQAFRSVVLPGSGGGVPKLLRPASPPPWCFFQVILSASFWLLSVLDLFLSLGFYQLAWEQEFSSSQCHLWAENPWFLCRSLVWEGDWRTDIFMASLEEMDKGNSVKLVLTVNGQVK